MKILKSSFPSSSSTILCASAFCGSDMNVQRVLMSLKFSNGFSSRISKICARCFFPIPGMDSRECFRMVIGPALLKKATKSFSLSSIMSWRANSNSDLAAPESFEGSIVLLMYWILSLRPSPMYTLSVGFTVAPVFGESSSRVNDVVPIA